MFVISDADTARNIKKMVASLIVPKPQVLIKVIFLEVTYNNSYDVGLEGGVTKHISGSINGSGSNLFGLAQQGITPTSGINTLPGAGLYTIAGDSFEATVRAIAEKGKVEVLSRPSILARNAQQATIVVGQQVPLITGVTFNTFGGSENSISYQNVGIILEVTPFINADGTVEMIVAPQISSVDATQSQAIASTTNGSAITAPYLDIRSANTVVVTPDGQTVIIGGLMQNSKTSTDSKIPVLGDIPLLGALFHHKISANSKSELLIFLTPYVVKTPADLAAMSVDERGRYDLSPKAFTEKTLNNYLDSSPPAIAPPAAVPAPNPMAAPHQRP
jgi:general secretion pathway protein D